MRKATIIQLLAQRKRLIGVGLAIMIGIGFMTITMLAGQVIDKGFRNSVGAEYRNIDFVVESGDADLSPELIAAIEAVEGVADVHPATTMWIDLGSGGQSEHVIGVPAPDVGKLRDSLVLDSGRLPEGAGEVTLVRSTAQRLRVDEGGKISFLVPVPGSSTGEMVDKPFIVVGIWDGEGRYGADEFEAFLAPEDFSIWADGMWVPSLFVMAEPGANLQDVEAAVTSTVGAGGSVVSAEDKIDTELAEFGDETAVLKLGINAFALLALIVAGIVVSNTFAILIAQRTGEIALFRCAGATAQQVRRMVLTEALILGVVASVIGVFGAVTVANVLLRLAGGQTDFSSIPTSIGITSAEIVGPLLAGAVLAVLAAWAPARTAVRIDPLQALRAAQSPVGTGERPGAVRIGISLLLLTGGAILLGGGAALSYGGSPETGVLVGMLGGITTFLGVLVGASVLVPAAVAFAGRLVSRIGGVPTRVAASNSVRNPRRTTATTIALVIGVALVTMMSVGAESLKATLLNEVDSQTPWDLDVTQAGGPGDAAAFARFVEAGSRVEDIVASAAMSTVEFEIPDAGLEGQHIFTGGVVDPEALETVWRDADAIAGFGPGRALVPGWFTELTGIDGGETFSIVVDGHALELEAISSNSFENMIVVAEQDVAGLGVATTLDRLWIRLAENEDRDAVKLALYDLEEALGIRIEIGGMGGYRETLTKALDSLVYVITGLLGVAVLIAIIGVSNTLSLSVIERTRESALLRALGFTRKQLRQSLAVEGVMLAAIGSLIGIVLGIGFGWIGAITVVGDAWPISLALPVGRIALIVAAALLCGLVASILPARRAANADPVVALAEA